MASIRLRSLLKLRDALDPVFAGGCKLWNQSGVQLAANRITATVRFESDTVIGERGSYVEGRYERDLAILVQLFYQHNEEAEPFVSTEELLDAEIVKAEKAILTIDWSDVFGVPDALLHPVEVGPGATGEGQPFALGFLRFRLSYTHQARDTEAA